MTLYYTKTTLYSNFMKTKKKLQKPIDQDIHLKYRCPQCSQEHWLAYRQASTINFKVVCDCGEVFKVKRVIGFRLKFNSIKPKPVEPIVIETPKISLELLEKSVKLLVGYGFTKTEASDLINTSYINNPVDDFGTLVKQTLESLRN